jgi:hypothetical protein
MKDMLKAIHDAIVSIPAKIAIRDKETAYGETVEVDGLTFKMDQNVYCAFYVEPGDMEKPSAQELYLIPAKDAFSKSITRLVVGQVMAALVPREQITKAAGKIIESYNTGHAKTLKFRPTEKVEIGEVVAIGEHVYSVIETWVDETHQFLLDRPLVADVEKNQPFYIAGLPDSMPIIEEGAVTVTAPPMHIGPTFRNGVQKSVESYEGISAKQTTHYDSEKEKELVSFQLLVGINIDTSKCSLYLPE